jgi:hypothetical protein
VRYYTESEAALATGVRADTILLLLRRQLVPAQHLDGRWLLPESSVELLLDHTGDEPEEGGQSIGVTEPTPETSGLTSAGLPR